MWSIGVLSVVSCIIIAIGFAVGLPRD